MKKILTFLFVLVTLQITAQCVQITSIFVNSCTIGTGTGFCDSEGFNEMFTFTVGATPLNTANINVIWPNINNSFTGWCSNALTTLKTDSLNSTIFSSCGYLLQPPGGIIPAGANVIAITSENFCVAANSFEGLSDTMYIIYQCGGVSTGHFANNPSGPRTLTLSTTGACVQTTSATYTSAIPNTDGATALYDEFGNVSYVINGCSAPVITVNPFWTFTNAICNNYGIVDLNTLLLPTASTGGIWSGVGVIGSTFNPSGILGTTSITYSVSPSGNCTETLDSTIVFSVDTTPIVTQFVQSCDSAFVNGAWYSTDAFVTFTSPGIPPYGCNTLNEITVDITGSIIDSSYFFSCDSVLFNGIWFTASVELRDTVVGIPATPSNNCNELFISEYGEGSSNNKYIEIYNGTGAPVDLSNYTVELYSNGSTTISQSMTLSGFLADGAVYVIAHASSNPTILVAANITNSLVMNFNGDDAVALRRNGNLVDLIGNIGCQVNWTNGGLSTQNNTIIRNPDYTTGVTIDPPNTPCDFPTLNTINWSALGNDNWSNIGTHTANCGGVATGGCDTVFITTIEIAQPTIFNTTNLCTNNPLEVSSINDTIQSASGCDSLITTTITNLVTPTQNITQACTNNPALVGTDTTSTITTTLGCDSIYLVTNTTLVVLSQNITQVCTNNPANAGQVTTSVISSSLGCDSIINITNTTLVTPTQNITQACTNNPANGGMDTTSVVLSTLGCDSIYLVTNTTLVVLSQNITQVCTNNPANAGQVTTSVISSSLGCDSIINIANTTLVTPTQNITQACTNNPANVGMDTTSIIPSALGCDSILNIINTTLVTPTIQNLPTQTGCNQVIFNGIIYTSNTTLNDTILSNLGCDSIFNQRNIAVNLPVTIQNPNNPIIICESGDFATLPDGSAVNTAGTYPVIFENGAANGCDSTIITTVQTQVCAIVCTNTFTLGADTNLCFGETLTLSVPTGYDSYTWQDGSTNQSFNVTSSGTYYATANQIDLSNNLVVNGDFEQGNTGFTTDYIVGTGGAFGQLSDPATYAITTSPSNVHNNFSFCTDQTTGTGNMFVANGADVPNTNVWCQTINITPNTDYLFSTWVTNVINDFNVAILQFSINGVQIGTNFSPTATGCDWQQFGATWNSSANTSAIICIVNQNTSGGGNDFALDDIFFTPVCIYSDTVQVQIGNQAVENITQACTNNPANVGQVTTSITLTALGCDSVINITNTTLITPTQNITLACTNNPANVGQVTTSIIQSALGCDSILNVTNTTLLTPTENITLACTNNPANAGSVTTSVIQSALGCDSILNITQTNLIIQETTSITLSGCDSVVWNGITYFDNFNSSDTTISALGCDSIIASLSITVTETPTASAGEDVTILLGESTTLIATEGSNYNWNWTGNSSNEQIIDVSPNETTLYIVTVSNGNCADSDSVLVTVITRVTQIFIPDAFTPNGDGINDVFQVVNAQDFDNILMRVFNRWGELIHEGTGANHGWDGVYKGELQNVGVYVYYVKANNILNGLPLLEKGSVSLIR